MRVRKSDRNVKRGTGRIRKGGDPDRQIDRQIDKLTDRRGWEK